MVGFHLANTELITSLERRIDMTEKKKMGRPKGETPPMVSTSMRLPKDIVDYFKSKHPKGWHKAMRKVLFDFIKKEK